MEGKKRSKTVNIADITVSKETSSKRFNTNAIGDFIKTL